MRSEIDFDPAETAVALHDAVDVLAPGVPPQVEAENEETADVRIFANEQRKKAHCSTYDFSGPVLRRCSIWDGARPRRFPAGRFHTQFCAIERNGLAESGYRR